MPCHLGNHPAHLLPQLIANLFHLADEDGNGTIEWDEFRTIFQVLRKMEEAGQL